MVTVLTISPPKSPVALPETLHALMFNDVMCANQKLPLSELKAVSDNNIVTSIIIIS